VLRPLAALLLLAPLLAPAATADWASFHADARGSGFIPNSTYSLYEDVWWNNKTLANAQVHASPVIKDGILITADLGSPAPPAGIPANAGLVRALDVESGRELWSYRMPGPVEGTPAIAGERVYVVDTGGNLKALNLRDGRVETSAAAGVGATLGSIREHEGKVFIGNEAGEMKAYLASSLTLLWTFSLGQGHTLFAPPAPAVPPVCTLPLTAKPIRGAPAVFDGKVFFGSMNFYVIAVDEEGRGDGTTGLLWFHKTGDVVLGAPSIDIVDANTHRVVVGSYDGKVYSFDPSPSVSSGACGPGSANSYGSDNNPSWTYEVPSIVDATTGEKQVSKVQSSPANSGNRVYVGANNGHVYGLDATNGALAWEQAGTGNALKPVTSSPAVANGIVVVGSEDTRIYWLSASNGSILKSFATKASIQTSPAVDGVRVLISATDGTTYMFGPKVPPRSDLTVASVTATPVTITVTVKNLGTDAAPAGTVRILLDGTFLEDIKVDALGAGQQQVVTHTGALAPGQHVIKASADWTNTAKESAESNNDFTLTTQIQAPAPPPTAATSSDTKKGPGAGIAFAALLLGCAAVRRSRKSQEPQ
jgi:outer membrane protein assembly factor BamB